MPREGPPAVEAEEVSRSYLGASRRLWALRRVSLGIGRGEIVALVGPSGSGKSTLLSILGGLDEPDTGIVKLAGVDWRTLTGPARARFRRLTCGFIVQGMTLLPQATAAENVEVPLLLEGIGTEQRARRVAQALECVGLASRSAALADQLSGGEQQRVAIARALVLEPAIVLADEPTASLDSLTAQSVTRLLVSLASDRGTAVVLVTHDPAVARHAHRTIAMHSGSLE